jgi:hypothetical protein
MRSMVKVAAERLRQMPRLTKVLTESRGLINTTDLLVATAATVVLSAGIGGAAISTLNEAKYGKAQPDATTIAQAITNFYKDTGKWPGQVEQAADLTQVVLLATGSGSYASSTYSLPHVAASGLKTTGIDCANNSLEGFVSQTLAGYDSSETDAEITGVTVLNINDYLVRTPDATKYPNWKGPYVQDINNDPWQRSWVAYLAPLYCSETLVSPSTNASGLLGYAWLVSGGSNRTITTPATSANLDSVGDDTGVVLGKLVTRSAPVGTSY